MTELAAHHLGDLAALLQERIGLHLRPEAMRALSVAVAARFGDRAPPPVGPDGYVALLRSGAGADELRRLLPLVTVGKTSFFRDQRQFDALAALLPGLLARRRAEGRAVSIWSAGCATGEEAWSIAMTAAEAGAEPRDLELCATDVNAEAVAQAERGAFAARRLRGVPSALAERHFEQAGDVRRVNARLRALLARAEPHNLVSRTHPLPAAGEWDAVFCRNVIIYFDKATARAVLARFLRALAPGGWLFLGSSESLFGLFDGLELVEVAGALLYRRPVAPGAGAPADAPEKLERP
jgi:chemotaxis protein methyltransferase CheR